MLNFIPPPNDRKKRRDKKVMILFVCRVLPGGLYSDVELYSSTQ